MPFTTGDRDIIRDLFSYTWDDHDLIDRYLADAFNQFGESVVNYVRDRFDSIETVEARDYDPVQGYTPADVVSKINVYDEIAIEKQLVSEKTALKSNAADRQKLINEISRAIGLIPKQPTLLRS